MQSEGQRISETTLEFSSVGRVEPCALYNFPVDNQNEADVFVTESHTKIPLSQLQHSHIHFGKSCTSVRYLGAHAELDKEHLCFLCFLPSSENSSIRSLSQSPHKVLGHFPHMYPPPFSDGLQRCLWLSDCSYSRHLLMLGEICNPVYSLFFWSQDLNS